MLVPAILYKDKIESKFYEELYSDKMFYYNGYAHCNSLTDIKPAENCYQFAIINSKKELVGYFAYRVDMTTKSVYNFGLYSFKTDPVIGFSIYSELKRLLKIYHRLEWRVIEGNPVKRHYDNFCKRFGGNIVCLHDATIDNYGNYHNEYIYEIISK